MNLKEHLKNADDLACAFKFFEEVRKRSEKHFGKNRRLMKFFSELMHSGGVLSKIQSELSSDYEATATNTEFSIHEFIYYNLEERHEARASSMMKMRNNGATYKEIASKYGLSPTRVNGILKKKLKDF